MFTRAFWRDAAERAAKTAAQAAILAIGADQVNALTVGWVDVLGFAAGGLALSLLTSIASAGAAQRGTASLVRVDPDIEPGDVNTTPLD